MLMDLQFHFSSILSPWIRRSLVAASFGTGSSEQTGIRHEVAPVTRYHDAYIADPQHVSEVVADEANPKHINDPESIIEAPISSSSRSSSDLTIASIEPDTTGFGACKAPLVPTATPYFHFDLAAAVRAAETGVVNRHKSYHTFDDRTKERS